MEGFLEEYLNTLLEEFIEELLMKDTVEIMKTFSKKKIMYEILKQSILGFPKKSLEIFFEEYVEDYLKGIPRGFSEDIYAEVSLEIHGRFAKGAFRDFRDF